MTSFKVPNKTLTILRKNCLKLLHTNGSRVTYWRLPTYFQWKAFLLQNLKAMKASKLSITKLQKSPQFWWLFSLRWFTQFGVLLSPIALKVVDPFLLDSKFFNGWHQSSFPIPYMATHKQGNKDTFFNDPNPHLFPFNTNHPRFALLTPSTSVQDFRIFRSGPNRNSQRPKNEIKAQTDTEISIET